MTVLDATIWIASLDNGYLLTYRDQSVEPRSAIDAEKRRYFPDRGELLTFLRDHWPQKSASNPSGR